MNTRSAIGSALAANTLLFISRAANAACVISGVKPTMPLPTMDLGQQFSFIATADCERLRFRVPGTELVEVPKPGPDTGSKDRTYEVVLTEREWNSLVGESDTTFTWSIIGMTSAGVTTRVTTTNEIFRSVTLNLSTADAKLVGERRLDSAGTSVSGAGDVDSNGHDDVLVGAWTNDEGGEDAGAAYLVLGVFTGTLDLSLADAKLVGEEPHDLAGNSVSAAGDVDGDGHDDVLVGAWANDQGGEDAGAAYLILGPVTGTLDLALADAKLVGEEPGDLAGHSVAGVGDVNGDGRADLLLDGPGSGDLGVYDGAAYLVLGPVTEALDLALADAKLVGSSGSLVLHGLGFASSGSVVSGAGDVDGNGHDDLLVSLISEYGDSGEEYAGAAYLVLGPVTGILDLSLADAKLVGEAASDYAGSVSDAGDVDGDGHDDVLVGACLNDEGGKNAGAAYLVLGPVTGTRDLSLADAKLVGEEAYGHTGHSVSGAGDVNDDGHDDLLVGADNPEGQYAGATYLVLGPLTGTRNLSRVDAKLVGEEAYDSAGISASGAGDVDGDGHDDVLVGSIYNDEGATSSGAVYLVYGGGL